MIMATNIWSNKTKYIEKKGKYKEERTKKKSSNIQQFEIVTMICF